MFATNILSKNLIFRTLGALALSTSLAMTGCGGGGDVPPGEVPIEEPPVANPDLGGDQDAPESLADSLAALGVDLDRGNRLDDDDRELPASYGPFGPRWRPEVRTELYAAGLAGLRRTNTDRFLFEDLTAAELGPLPKGEVTVAPEVLMSAFEQQMDAGPTYFPDERAYLARAQRAVVAADVDGDGRDEIVTARIVGGNVLIDVIEDSESRHTESTEQVLSGVGAKSVALAAIDLDGQGTQGLVIATEAANTITLRFASLEANGWSVRTALDKTLSLSPTKHGTKYAPIISMAAGNLDRDGADELAVVLNQIWIGSNTNETSEAVWFAYDDAASGFSTIVDGKAVTGQAFDLPSDPNAPEDLLAVPVADHTAVFAEVAIADFDQDGKGEVALGGLEFLGEPSNTPNRDRHTAYYVLMLRDGLELDENDQVVGLDPIGARAWSHRWLSGEDLDNYNRQRFTVQMSAMNATGDNGTELLINQYLIGLEKPAAGRTQFFESELPELGTIGDRWLLDPTDSEAPKYHFSRAVSAMATGDVTGDGRDDVVIAHELAREIAVYSFMQRTADESTFGVNGVIDRDQLTIENHQVEGGHPVLVLADVDVDGVTLQFTPTEKKLFFTEPLIHAVLAAAPGKYGIGQQLASNRTSWGVASISEEVKSQGASISASAWVGGQAGFKGLGAEVTVRVTTKVSTSLQKVKSNKYSVTETETRSIGLGEDGKLHDLVVFTTLPVDLYEYKIVSHPDAEKIGETVTIALPRVPVTIQATLEDYDRLVVGAKPDLGLVMSHTPGDPSTYASSARKDALLAQWVGHAMSRSVSVGLANGGNVSRSLSITEAMTEQSQVGADIERSVEVTAGGFGGKAIGGFSVGAGATKGLSVTLGESATYTGTVGDILGGTTAERFQHRYDWGLFTYLYTDAATGQSFQVVTYWVE